MKHNARVARLLIEQEKLLNLSKRSEFIQVQPVEVQPGWPPEKYVVTFTCKGIASINEQGAPQSSELHQVSIYLSRDFPMQEPYLIWLTPIWHPNIEHQEPHHVCTNNVQNWYPGKALDDLVVVLGEMVQYKRYHAEWAQPWPLDKEAAQWVREYAEPRKIIGPKTPFDERPLLREYKIRRRSGKGKGKNDSGKLESPPPTTTAPHKTGGLKLGVTKKITTDSHTTPTPKPQVVRKKGLKLGAGIQFVNCPGCGQTNRIRPVEGVERAFFCGNCSGVLTPNT